MSPPSSFSVPPAGEQPRSRFMQLWEQADQLVPFPFLYCWHADTQGVPPRAHLHQLNHVKFTYNLATNFTAIVEVCDGRFHHPIIVRESFGYRLMPVQSRDGLLSPEQAERAATIHLHRHERNFLELLFLEEKELPEEAAEWEKRLLTEWFVLRWLELPWQSITFEHPLRMGEVEPVYKFRRFGCRCEFIVGALTGRVRHEYLSEHPLPGSA